MTHLLPMCEQEPYVKRGLDLHLASLLSCSKVPRGEVAAYVLCLVSGMELEKKQLEIKLSKKDFQLKHVTRRHLQARKLWHPRGILGAVPQQHRHLYSSAFAHCVGFNSISIQCRFCRGGGVLVD